MNIKTISSSNQEEKIFEILKVDTIWLSTFDAAQFLGISPNALRILACRGRVNFYKFGRRLRFSRCDLEKLFKKGT